MIKREIQQILKQLNITPKKSKGQNFLIDSNIKKKIIALSDISERDIILEIGSGLGALTSELIKRAKKVISVEIEPKFCEFLSHEFSDNDNLEIINGDILKIDIPIHDKVVANTPYTITGPLLERIFFKKNPPQGILTIEESLAKRIFNVENYRMLSRINIGVNSFMSPEQFINISPNCFYPVPKIKLALIKISPKNNINSFLLEQESREFYLRFIAGIMPYKNKNIANALDLFLNKTEKINYSRASIMQILKDNKFENDKTFTFTIDKILEICKLFYFLKKK
ncbi:MAG: rRNA adenine N-6-methyltransferase family protein [Promethearchaeota archaeon]